MGLNESEFGDWIVKRRWTIVIATMVGVCAAAYGALFLSFNNDIRVFFSPDNPQLTAMETQESIYTKNDNILFAVAPKNGNVFTRETLAAIEELTAAAWQIPYSSRVDALTNFQHTQSEEDDLIVENLVENAMTLDDEQLERIKTIALSEPLLLNRQISPTGHVAGVSVTIVKPDNSLTASPQAAARAKKIAADLSTKFPAIDIYLTGSVMIDTAFREATERDMVTLFPAMFLVMAVILWVALHSFAGMMASLAVIGISVLTALGLAGWFGMSLTTPSAMSPTIILTLAIADSVHILVTMFQQIRLGTPKNEAIAESLRVNLQPVFITSMTTTIGFLSMNFSDVPPFRDLGNIVAIGVIAAFFYSVLFLPALMAILPIQAKSKALRTGPNLNGRLSEWVIYKRKSLFWGLLAVIGILTCGIGGIELNDNFIQYFDERYDFRRATNFIEDHLTGFDIIEYSLDSDEPGGINEPEYLHRLDKFKQWYLQQPNVVRVDAFVDRIKTLNKNMHADQKTYYRIPASRELAAQYLLLYEMSLPFGLDLNNMINVDKSATRMVVTLKNVTSKDLRTRDASARRWLAANAPQWKNAYGTGLSIMFAHISKRNIESMLGGSFLALALISGILVLALRSFKLGAISLVPNLAPAFMAFGVWGMTMKTVGIALSVMVAMTIGIVVDDTVHFLSKYLRAKREMGMNSHDAVRFAFKTVGLALIVTTLALVSGFTIFSFSGFRVNSDMGTLTAVTLSFALALDFLFLPSLLMRMKGR